MVNGEIINCLKNTRTFPLDGCFLKAIFFLQKLFLKATIFPMDIIFIAVAIGIITKLFKDKKKSNGRISENGNWLQINFKDIRDLYYISRNRH